MKPDLTVGQVNRAARLAGIKPRRARLFLQVAELIRRGDIMEQERDDAKRELVRASGAKSPIPDLDRRHDFVQAADTELVLHVIGGEMIEGDGPAQAFAVAGTYTLPPGGSCVWVHAPERTLVDALPDPEVLPPGLASAVASGQARRAEPVTSHTRMRRSGAAATICHECDMPWGSEAHRVRLADAGVPLDAVPVTVQVPTP